MMLLFYIGFVISPFLLNALYLFLLIHTLSSLIALDFKTWPLIKLKFRPQVGIITAIKIKRLAQINQQHVLCDKGLMNINNIIFLCDGDFFF